MALQFLQVSPGSYSAKPGGVKQRSWRSAITWVARRAFGTTMFCERKMRALR
jgi:hypothetical protein